MHFFPVDVTDVVPDLGVFRYHVWHFTGIRNHVVNSGRRFDVLAHHVDAVVHELDSIEGAAAIPGIRGSVSCLPEEFNFKIVHGPARLVFYFIFIGGMPIDDCIESVENAGFHHVNFSDHRLFSGRSKEFERSFNSVFFQGIFKGNGATDTGSCKQIMSTAMP